MAELHWHAATALVLVIGLLFAASEMAGADDRDGGRDVSVVSYNMRHFQGYSPDADPNWAAWADVEWYPNPDRPGFYEFYEQAFRSLDADVIAIQESTVPDHTAWGAPPAVHDEMRVVPELARRLGMQCYVQEKSRFHGFALLSRFPIADSRDLSHGDTPGVGLVRVSIQVDDQTVLNVYNTHLHWRDPAIRAQELAANQEEIDAEGLMSHLYVGDFNIQPMASRELDFVRANGYEGFGHTLDYVWTKTGGDVRIVAFAPVENAHTSAALSGGRTVASDHIPVKAVVRIGDQPIHMDERLSTLRRIVGLDVAEDPAIRNRARNTFETYAHLLQEAYGTDG